MRFSFYNRDAAGEHVKVIPEGQHKESIMFLAERPANHWVSFSIFQAQNANACHTTDSGGELPPYRPRTKRPGRAELSSSSRPRSRPSAIAGNFPSPNLS